jgi:hypothetical protein
MNDTNNVTPYALEWNLAIQKLFGKDTSVEAAYVGSRSLHLHILNDYNQPIAPGPGDVNSRRPFPQMDDFDSLSTIGHSYYDSLQVKAERHFSGGVAFLGSYTFSKLIDVGCSSGWEGCDIQNAWSVFSDRALSALNVPQVFSGTVVAELPFGKGKLLLNNRGIGSSLLGNWQVNAIVSLVSGLPYDVNTGLDIANVGNGTRPDVTGSPTLSNPTVQQWLNVGAFALPAPYTFGTMGRNSLRGPNSENLDFSVIRSFSIGEKARLQFRAELFNAFNHANFGIPDNNMQDPSFGTIYSAGPARVVQFALKFLF